MLTFSWGKHCVALHFWRNGMKDKGKVVFVGLEVVLLFRTGLRLS